MNQFVNEITVVKLIDDAKSIEINYVINVLVSTSAQNEIH